MKFVVLFLMIGLNFPVFSAGYSTQKQIVKSVNSLKAINAELLELEDEEKINALIEKQVTTLDTLMQQLKRTLVSKLTLVNNEQKIKFLKSRIQVNQKRQHKLAVQRDQMELQTYKIDQDISHYLTFLIESSKNYKSIEAITSRTRELLNKSLKLEDEIAIPLPQPVSKVTEALNKNYYNLLSSINSYQDILMYVNINPRKIASVHWFQEFSLLSIISYINQFNFVQSFNYKIAPLGIDTGGVLVSISIFLLVFFSYPFIFKCTSWCIENYVIEKDSERQEIIYHQLRRPLRTLLVFFGLNLSADALFYKTGYQQSLDSLAFILYSLIIIWFIFKIIDSVVLVKIEKLSSANIELRKELFNLGVQSLKAFIVIVTLTFALNHFGISLTAIASTLGIGGLAFALAAKDTLSNLFGGITILFDNVFRMGDWVTVNEFEGTVAEIGLRSVTIRTFDNALITIPNSVISVSGVKNWNRRAIGRRIKMHIGVTYESNMDDLRQCLQDIREMLRQHPDIANPKQRVNQNKKMMFKFTSMEDTHGIKSTQLVFFDKYSDFSIDILIYCFTRTTKWEEWLAVKEDVLFKIAEILEKNNLEFAYPTQVRIYRPEAKNPLPFQEESY